MIKKGQNVIVVTGKDKGKKGKVLKAFPAIDKVIVEGVNLQKKHVRPKKQGEKGQMVEVTVPIDISNIKLICDKCNKATRVGYKVEGKEKFRICKKCEETIK